MTTQYATVTWNDFRQGSTGPLDTSPGKTLPLYSAENMQAYRSGILGPRPPWQLLKELTGVAKPTEPDAGIFVWNNKVHVFTQHAAGTERWLDLSSLTESSSGVSWPALEGSPIHIASWGDNEAAVVGGREAVPPPLTSGSTPGGAAITTPSGTLETLGTVYRDRSYVAGVSGSSAEAGRIWYSEPGQWTTYLSDNWFDDCTPNVAGVHIAGLWGLRNGLLICTEIGDWWVLSGADPVQGTLRYIGNGPVPTSPHHVVVANDRVMFLSRDMRYGVTMVSTSGIDTTTLAAARPGFEALTRTSAIGPNRAMYSSLVGAVVLPYGDSSGNPALVNHRSLELVNGAWNYSIVDWNTSGDVNWWDYSSDGQYIYALIEDDTTSKFYIVRREIYTERFMGVDEQPPWSASGNTNVGHVVLDKVTHNAGYLIRPRRIDLKLRHWQGYPSASITPAGTVKVYIETPSGGKTLVSSKALDPSGWATSMGDYDGNPVPVSMGVDAVPWSDSYQIELEDLHAVAIEKVTVVHEVDVNRPRY